jgi:hypothetical protein
VRKKRVCCAHAFSDIAVCIPMETAKQVRLDQGIVWFLNLCFTYDLYEKNLLKEKSSKLGWCNREVANFEKKNAVYI